MSETTTKPAVGSVGWMDLTVPDAPRLRDFYQDVTGWTPSEHSMGDYADYVMSDAGGKPVSGVCHARGGNASLPPQWLIYITVENLDRAMDRCRAGGGEVINGPRQAGEHGRFCVIRDPAGAAVGLFENS